MSTWFITGCSTGFGRALAQATLARGWNTVVTARDPAAIADLADGYPNALPLALDVADHGQVVAAVAAANARFGGIDVLVNNAGYGYRSAVEEGERAAIEAMFAVNFYGAIDLIQQVLPQMRERRSGTIINMSSVAGRMTAPGSGFYAASKCALEGMSDGLRVETAEYGIRVLVVEPGPFRTDFAGRSLVQSEAPLDAYAKTAGARRKENDSMDGTQPGDPVKGAQAIIAAATAENPPFRLPLGVSAVTRIRELLAQQAAELEAWAEVGLATDF
ncbi:MAG: SDR family NAD(P)-dependent oxidoreductase [Propionibacteriaceae bacterium]|jgi:NAD(P)-dependent dehydrogenase (short-subunit alcohol dehydrogenase family)|nr:SDR family NAD(P)-dependent oxidoreductase [Propionibacteriaceae bacterium]